MSAAYRPYKDDDSCENVHTLEENELNWSDNEPVSVHIYEKTTESRPFTSNRRYLYTCGGVGLASFFVGFIIGIFGHSNSSHCVVITGKEIEFDYGDLTKELIDGIDSKRIENEVRDFSRKPRIPGGDHDRYLVNKMKNIFHDANFDSVFEDEYKIPISLPDHDDPNFVAIVDKRNNSIVYTGAKIVGDAMIPFIAYSANGNIESDVVFFPPFSIEQYKDLMKAEKFDSAGKIAITCYGKGSIIEQLYVAKEAKFAGLILFPCNENIDTGVAHFPDDAVGWGSLLKNNQIELTLNKNHHPDRIHVSEYIKTQIPSIPVQPISRRDARFILSNLRGPLSQFDVGLGFNFSIGPGFKDPSHRLRLFVNNKLKEVNIKNVFGLIKGARQPDEYVLIGNHRDSFTQGAADAGSGSAILLEIAHIYGKLLTKGWRPQRSLLFCSWASLEFNSLSLTQWIDDNFPLLTSGSVAYISLDLPVIGNESLSVSASPLLYSILFNATRLVPNPDKRDQQASVYDKWFATFPIDTNQISPAIKAYTKNKSENFIYEDLFLNDNLEKEDKMNIKTMNESFGNGFIDYLWSRRPLVKPLNQRSTYSPFFSKLGVPVVDLFYSTRKNQNSPAPYSLIHTQYDTIDSLRNFDSDFRFHRAVTSVVAEMIHHLVDSLFVPFNLFYYSQVMRTLFNNIRMLTQLAHDEEIRMDLLESAMHNFTVASGSFHLKQLTIDSKK